MNHADRNRKGELARNVAVALRFKKSQGTPEMPQVEREVLAPNYDRARGGNFHLASNARDQGWPHPGMYLRTAFPDRVDVIEEVIAEGDRVGLLFRVTATHTGNFFGIPATGTKVDVYEIAMLRIVGGQMVEGWFMMDETALLKQLGAAAGAGGTTAAGALVVREALAVAGVPLAGISIVDGSGLSLLDRLTAGALVSVLRAGAADPAIRDGFLSSLAVAGVSGTLKSRLDRRPAYGRVIAKTGTTSLASSLAGFVRGRYVFAIVQNGSPVPWWTARAAQDRFVTLLAKSAWRPISP